METMEEYKTIRIINDEPEFCAGEKTNVQADYFILCEEGKALFGKNIYDVQVCGMSLLNWVVRACGTQPKILNVESGADALASIRPYLDFNAEYSVVFYTDTPLLNKNHISDLLAFVERKRMNVCVFKRGYVFRNEFIKDNDEFYSVDEYDFASNDFFVVNNLEDFSFAKENLEKKVFSFHKRNGVFFENEASSVVDANTEIGDLSVILSGSSIVKGTRIGKNSYISKNATISGSTIGANAVIGTGALILNSIIKDNVYIGDGAIITNSVIGNNCSLELGVKIVSSSLRENVVVKNFSVIDDGRIGENCIIQKHSKVIGITEKSVIGSGSEIGANATVSDCCIKPNSEIKINETIKGKVR